MLIFNKLTKLYEHKNRNESKISKSALNLHLIHLIRNQFVGIFDFFDNRVTIFWIDIFQNYGHINCF